MGPSRGGRPGKTPIVLVGILKDRRDLRILLGRRWYRVPVRSCPKRDFHFLAFYQPSAFGRGGKIIRYYARVAGRDVRKRRELLPGERRHPRAGEEYFRFRVGTVRELVRPIRNRGPRRVTFGFTTLKKLLRAKDLLELFDVPPLERIVGGALKRGRVAAIPEHPVSTPDGRRYRLDFAVFCRNGKIDVECDGERWHSTPEGRRRDAERDRRLAHDGWKVVRLRERAIVGDPKGCVARVRRAADRLGGATEYGS